MPKADELWARHERRLRMKLGRAIRAMREAGVETCKLPVRGMEAALLSALLAREADHVG